MMVIAGITAAPRLAVGSKLAGVLKYWLAVVLHPSVKSDGSTLWTC